MSSSTSIVIVNLTGKLSPRAAVSALEGLRFKMTERRMKRYFRGNKVAEACLDGPLKVYYIAQQATLPDAMLVSRRYLTLADFPFTSYMDSERLVRQHTTFLTHRVTLVCEVGLDDDPSDDCVRIEWDFASGKKAQESKVADDHAERVDFVLSKLGVSMAAPASLTLKRLRAARAAQAGKESPSPIDKDDDAEHLLECRGIEAHEERVVHGHGHGLETRLSESASSQADGI